MKTKTAIAVALLCSVCSVSAYAKDERLQMPIADAMGTAEAKEKLEGDIKFYFGKQKHPAGKSKGSFTANRKTNFVGKSNDEGCQRAFLSSMISLKERAEKEGGNAVVGIKSVYKKDDFVSETEYICGAGNVMGGVALRGEVIKLP